MNIHQEIVNKVNELHLPESEQAAAIEVIRTNLFQRVGIRLAEQLSDDVLQQFTQLAKNDEQASFEYLNSQVADFENLVRQELDTLIEQYSLLS